MDRFSCHEDRFDALSGQDDFGKSPAPVPTLQGLENFWKAIVLAWSISPGGSPPKGMNKEYSDFFLIYSLKFGDLKLWLLAFPQGPGGFREVREAGRNHFHLSWYLIVPGVTSYKCQVFFRGVVSSLRSNELQRYACLI